MSSTAVRTEPRRNAFARVWMANTVSAMGTAVTNVALPLVAIYNLHAGAFEVGVLSAATVAAWLIVGLPAGVLVHRLPLRAGLVTADLLRAAALITVPIAVWLHILHLAQLVIVALLIGVCSVLFDVGFATFLPAVVPKEELTSRNSLLQGSESVSQVAGPAIGGTLAQLIGAASSLIVDVASYLFSAICLVTLPSVSEHAGSRSTGSLAAQIREGLRFVRRDPLVGPMTLAATSLNFTGAAIGALSSLFLVRTLHLPAGLVGVLIAASGLGGVLGASLAPWAVRRLGSAQAAVWSMIVAPVFAVIIAGATRGPLLVLFVVGNLGLAAATVVFSVVARTHRQVAVPPELLARVMATVRFVSWGVLPIGGLVAGVLGQWLGVRTALFITAAVLFIGPVPMLLSPARRQRNLVEEAPVAEPVTAPTPGTVLSSADAAGAEPAVELAGAEPAVELAGDSE